MLPYKLNPKYICFDYNIQTQKDVKNSDAVEVIQNRAVDAKDLIAKSENGNCETHLMDSAENLMSVLIFTKVGNSIEEPIPVKRDVKSSHDVIAKADKEDDGNVTTQGTSSLMNMVTSPVKSLEVLVFYPDASADIVNCFNGMPSALRGHDKLSKPKCLRDIKVLASSNINQSRTSEDVTLMMVPDELDAGTEMIEKRIPFSTKKKRPDFLKTYPLQKKPLRCSTVRLPLFKSRYEAATPEVSLNLIWRRGGDVNPPAVKKEVDVEVAMLRKLFKFHKPVD